MLVVDLWLRGLDVGPERLAALAALLPAAELARAGRFVFEIDRARFIAGRGQLREILSEATGAPPAALTITQGADGKPALPAFPDGPQFNLSHCGGLALVAVSPRVPVGVDIEEIKPLQEDLDTLFLTAREQTELRGLTGESRLHRFYRLWTCKEAVVKARATGLSTDPANFRVAFSNDWHGQVEWATPEDAETGPLIVQSFVPKPGYLAAVATLDLTHAVTLNHRT